MAYLELIGSEFKAAKGEEGKKSKKGEKKSEIRWVLHPVGLGMDAIQTQP